MFIVSENKLNTSIWVVRNFSESFNSLPFWSTIIYHNSLPILISQHIDFSLGSRVEHLLNIIPKFSASYRVFYESNSRLKNNHSNTSFNPIYKDSQRTYSGFQLTLAARVRKHLGNLGTTFQNSRFHCYWSQSNCEL